MSGRLLLLYLRDRVGLIILVGLNSAILLLLVYLSQAYPVDSYAGYAVGLSATLLSIYLAVDLFRWWSFARQARALAVGNAPLEALANLPPGHTAEQQMARELVTQLQRQFLAEDLRVREEYQRHLNFIHHWVHQMKTPVAAITLMIDHAETAEPEDLPATLAGVGAEAAKLADGLELVLSMARLQEFARDYQIRRVDLLGAVREIINHRKQQFIRSGIFPEVVADVANDWTVLTDAKWNQVVIDQVVANALKYAAQAGPEGQRLTFRLLRQERAVLLQIADQGPGIPEMDLPRLFEPFFTGENGRRFGGATGIGLWLVKQVVDRLGHQVAVESPPGAGTTVTITYPLTTL